VLLSMITMAEVLVPQGVLCCRHSDCSYDVDLEGSISGGMLAFNVEYELSMHRQLYSPQAWLLCFRTSRSKLTFYRWPGNQAAMLSVLLSSANDWILYSA